MKRLLFISCILLSFRIPVLSQSADQVSMREDTLTLPTYPMEPNDVNPIFFRNESYQGASRVIYPYPAMDNFTNRKESRTYKALYLENKYLRLCILPELGGKLFYAIDKTDNYDLFYHQHVIKPAYIGMLGAWISGGIEWCVFHHHRASTFMPVNYSLQANPDGSKTIWFGETEPRQRMTWTIGITLYPDKSFIEASVKLFNNTPFTHSILYWANVATHVNDNYRVFFPPSVQYAVYHAKNSFSHWPVTYETYNGHEYYRDSVDASWWKNHPNPISFFAFNLKEGFLAGYDYGKHAGTLHVADPHVTAGAKLWEWGPGPEGSFWDSQVLTDSDGPYAELMAGAFSDNQPDYSWIKPYEFKHFKQYWYPLRETKGVKNANLNACVNLDINGNKIIMAFNTTAILNNARVALYAKDRIMYAETITIDPSKPYYHEIEMPKGIVSSDLRLSLSDASGNEIISYQPRILKFNPDLPEPVSPPPIPAQIKTNEELYYTGLRIRQFHNAQLNALDYFNEALKRDPYDVRCNIELGLDDNQKGMYGEATGYFRQALIRQTKDYTRPLDCTALYNLGLSLMGMEKYDDAYDTLFRATWDYAYRSASYFQLARIACLRGNDSLALEHINNSLETNSPGTAELNLKSAILRKLQRYEESLKIAARVREINEIDPACRYETYLGYRLLHNTASADAALSDLTSLLGDNPESYLEMAVSYMAAGFNEEATSLLGIAASSGKKALDGYPTIYYYLGYLSMISGNSGQSQEYFNKARLLPTDYCFPFRLESVKIYQAAIRENEKDSRACYYLGDLLYDRQPLEAMEQWKRAVEYDPELSIAWRNLGWGYYYAMNNIPKAIECYETAIRVNPSQAKYYYELDRLYEENNTRPESRLKILTGNHSNVIKREDALIREIRVLVLTGDYDQAIRYLSDYYFHAQEGSRDLHDTYVDAYLLRGLNELRSGNKQAALKDFLQSIQYPANQQIGRDPDYARLTQVYYLIGLGYEGTGNRKMAQTFYLKAADFKPPSSWYAYYRGLAMDKLRNSNSSMAYRSLDSLGNALLAKKDEPDFFAKFGNVGSENAKASEGYQALGLYNLSTGNKGKAMEYFKKSGEVFLSNAWAKEFLKETE